MIKKRYVFYYEEGLNAWLPVPATTDELITASDLALGDTMDISFKVVEMTEDEWKCAARIRKILKTSPAKAQVQEGYAGVTVWVGDRQVTQIVSQTELVYSNADELLRLFENARYLLTASPAPDRNTDSNKHQQKETDR